MLLEYWVDSTIKNYLAKFKKFILPVINPPEDFNHFKMKELEKYMKESLEDNARSNKLNARRSTQVYIHAGNTIYRVMQDVDSSLPSIELKSDSMKTQGYRREKPKHIPIAVQIKFEERVLEIMYDEPVLARAIVVFHSAGARPREAAGTIYSDFIYNDGYVLVDIAHQEKKGKRDPKLKTPAAYRKVVLDSWGEYIVKETRDLIGTEEDPKYAPISAKELSKRVKELLYECGITEDYYKRATLDMEQYPEYGPDGKPITDVTAYILRRNRCSIWGNYCKLDDATIDYQLGHTRNDESICSFDEKNPRAFQEVATKIKAINFIEMFKDCSIAKVTLGDKRKDATPLPKIHINNKDNEKKVRMFFRSAEPGDSVSIMIEGEVIDYKITSVEHNARPHSTLFGHIEEGD